MQRVLTGIFFCCFFLIFIVDAFIFNTYIKAPTISQVGSSLGLNSNSASADKTLHETVDEYLATISGVLSFYASTEEQLEFLTLTGLIFNALMQGYVCVNSIFVYLIENIETAPLDISTSAFSGGIFAEKSESAE
jgi:hypothetical protein